LTAWLSGQNGDACACEEEVREEEGHRRLELGASAAIGWQGAGAGEDEVRKEEGHRRL
jgi:hypothetical protein